MTEQELNMLKAVDLQKTSLDNLVDLKNINTKKEMSVQNKILDFIEQIKNPYLFKVDGIKVKINFKENGPAFQERFENYLKSSSKI